MSHRAEGVAPSSVEPEAVPSEGGPTVGTKVRRGLAWSTISALALRVGNFGVGVLMARLLAPAQFGVFAVALTVQAIVLAFVELGLTADLVRRGDIASRAATATTLSTGIGVVFAAAMVAAANPIADSMGAPQAAPVIRVMSLTLILAALATVPHAMMQRGFRQSTQFAVDGTSLVVNTAAVVTFVLLGFGAMSLALASVISLGTSCVLQYVVTRTRPKFGFDRTVARSLFRFGLPLALANQLSWIVMNVAYVIVGARSGPVLLGFYVLAFNMASWPMTSIGMALRVVALPAFAHLGPKRRAAGLSSATGMSWSVALLVGVGMSALATQAISLVYGGRWLPAAHALAGLAFFGSLRVVFDLLASFLIAAGATRAVFGVQILWLIALAPAVIIGLNGWGIAGAAWAHVVVGLAVALPAYVYAGRRHGVQPRELLTAVAVPVIGAVPAYFAGKAVAGLFHAQLLGLLAGGLTVTVIYVAVVAVWVRRQHRALSHIMDVVLDEEAPVPTQAGPVIPVTA